MKRVDLNCPFCKNILEKGIANRYWCKNCKRNWRIELKEQFIRQNVKQEAKKNEGKENRVISVS